ncbi:MAG: PrsW family glutamic-type intramembrane protease [Planctomycetota bacterium]
MILYAMLTLVVFILLAMIHRYDMHHREPWFMVVLAIACGAAGCWLIGPVADWLLVRFELFDSLSLALMAGTTEELTKFAIVLAIALLFPQFFNDPMDGIVYGALAGLGFALTESVFYIDLTQQQQPDIAEHDLFGQEAVRSVLHFVTGGLSGFGVGLARVKAPQWPVILPTWLGASILIHFAWDFACGLHAAQGFSQTIWQRTAAIGLMLVSLVLFRIAVWVAHHWAELQTEPMTD